MKTFPHFKWFVTDGSLGWFHNDIALVFDEEMAIWFYNVDSLAARGMTKIRIGDFRRIGDYRF